MPLQTDSIESTVLSEGCQSKLELVEEKQVVDSKLGKKRAFVSH